MRLRPAAAVLGAALLLAPRQDAAQDGSGAAPGDGPGAVWTSPPEVAPGVPAPDGAPPRIESSSEQKLPLLRPILLVGFGGTGHEGGVLGGDLGLRVEQVSARFAYRLLFPKGDGGYLTYASGRLGWIFAERSWAAAYAAVGAGKLTYAYSAPSSPAASVTAYSGELGVMFHPRWGGGPLVVFAVEALAPLARAPDPRNATLTAPNVAVTLNVNALAVLLWTFSPWHVWF